MALIGNPTAAAVPVTGALLCRYVAFTAREHRAALTEWSLRHAGSMVEQSHILSGRIPMWWFPDDVPVQIAVESAESSTRAAVVLSAAGVPLT